MSSNEASNPEPEVGVEATESPAKQAKKVASAPADTQGEESRDSIVSAEGDESVEGDEDEVGDEEDEEEDTDEEAAAAEKPRNGHTAKNGEATAEAVNGTADAKNRKRSAPNDEEEDGEEAAPTTESSAEDNVAQKKKRVDEPQQPDQPQVEAGAE